MLSIRHILCPVFGQQKVSRNVLVWVGRKSHGSEKEETERKNPGTWKHSHNVVVVAL